MLLHGSFCALNRQRGAVRVSIYIYVRGGWLQSAASPSLLVSKSLLCRAHNFFRPPLSYKPFLAFFSYGRQPRKFWFSALWKGLFPIQKFVYQCQLVAAMTIYRRHIYIYIYKRTRIRHDSDQVRLGSGTTRIRHGSDQAWLGSGTTRIRHDSDQARLGSDTTRHDITATSLQHHHIIITTNITSLRHFYYIITTWLPHNYRSITTLLLLWICHYYTINAFHRALYPMAQVLVTPIV